MTNLTVGSDPTPESLTEATSRRLRGALAERRMNIRQLATLLDRSYTWMHVRANGKHPLNLDELEEIEHMTGISATYLITGSPPSRSPDGSDGGLPILQSFNPKVAQLFPPTLMLLSSAA